MMHALYAKHCGKTTEFWEETMDRDTWLDPEQAVEIGLIDKIITTREASEEEDKD